MLFSLKNDNYHNNIRQNNNTNHNSILHIMNISQQSESVSMSNYNPHHRKGSDTIDALNGSRNSIEGQKPSGIGVD